jgi:Raf kinase inhibitor-like YbhB/YbcL family protein
MPNIPVDWAAVDWANVGLLSVIAFLAALVGNALIFRHRVWAAILAGLLFAAAYVFLMYYPHGLSVPGLKTGARAAPGTAAVAGLTLTSPEIAPGATIQNEQVYRGFDCNGTNISPELRWSGAPNGTKSFAVTLYDPDAPTGSGWWHWVIFNIPATSTFLPRNAGDAKMGLWPPGAVQVRTDYGAVGYGGPCPPRGDKAHRYVFTVFAVDVDKLPVDDSASPALVGFNLYAHTLKKTTLTGYYGR